MSLYQQTTWRNSDCLEIGTQRRPAVNAMPMRWFRTCGRAAHRATGGSRAVFALGCRNGTSALVALAVELTEFSLKRVHLLRGRTPTGKGLFRCRCPCLPRPRRDGLQASKLRSDGEAQLSTPFPALPRRINRRTHHRLRREGMTMRPRYRDGCEGESPISEPGWTVVSLTSTAPKTLSHKGCMKPARRPSDAGLTYVLPGGRWRASRSK